VPDSRPRGWALRLIDIFGGRPEDITEEHLSRLVAGGVREDADLDFKQERYGSTDSDKREMAADIAAMANDRGGLIIIGIRDENDVAVEPTPVELVDGEEARIRQTAAGNIAHHISFEIRVVPSESHPTRGYYLLIVPPSTLRPHAVRQDHNLRFPRRDGTTKRWLSEPEVADTYRDRYGLATDQAARVEQVLDEGFGAMDLDGDAFIGLAMVPTGLGSMAIDLARVGAIERWIRELGAPNYLEGFFEPGVLPTAGVGAHRVTLTSLRDTEQRPNWQYVELFEDGTGFACTHLSDVRDPRSEHPDTWILNEGLVLNLGRCLHLLGRHAVENCGAWGDALVGVRLVGHAMRLAHLQRTGGPERAAEIAGGRELQEAVSRHTLVVEAASTLGPALSAATRLVATDLFHAFGSAEVRQIDGAGTLRARYLGGDGELRAWAEQHGITVSDETVAGE
jgi:hypothetical protein